MKHVIKAIFAFLFISAAVSVNAADWAGYECGPGWGPSKSAAPTYPRRARQLGIEGYIVMQFSVNTDGTVADIAVQDAKPSRAFVRTATRAVESFEFPPCMTNGLATKITDISIKYDFNLEG